MSIDTEKFIGIIKAMKYKFLIIICVILTVLGAVGSILVLNSPPKTEVNIISDGKVIRSLDLSAQEDVEFTVTYKGKSNVVEVRDGKIRVKEADCPDKTCVKSGWLNSSAMPIVCLPNRLVIEFTDKESEVDAVAW